MQAQEAKIETVDLYRQVTGTVYGNEAFHVHEKGSPVRITSVSVQHIPRETASLANSYLTSLYRYLKDNEKIRLQQYAKESLKITISAQGEDVVAVKFGVVVYDAFKEYLGGLTAITMDPPTTHMRWDYNPAYLFKFKKYGVVGIYVRQARLRNGQIWNFDENLVTSEFSKRFGDVTKEQLVEAGSGK